MISTAAPFRFLAACFCLVGMTAAVAQVSPTEVKNPRAKSDEQKYLPQLVSLQRAIGDAQFPFTFRLARYLDAKPGQRAALDSNGIEFVEFQQRIVLKVSGFYRVAFNSMQVTQNGRASQTMLDAVLPILRMVTEKLPQSYDYDAIGFEILYDARDSSGSFDYEGREVLAAVFGRDDAFALARSTSDAERQEILDRSDIFVNGKQFALGLGGREPGNPEERSSSKPTLDRASFRAAEPPHALVAAAIGSPDASRQPAHHATESAATDMDAATMQRKLQGEVSAIRNSDTGTEQADETTAPALETNGDRKVLHFTMQNSLSFESNQTSIYKRAAQSFDLFLAPELKDISKKVPADAAIDGLHFSVLNHLGAGKDETIEYICPMDSMRSFVEDKITTQDLINKSTVLVNGVRIGLTLQLVE
jgi:hypothetical protein